jgi:hypothetical protein
MSAVAWAAAGYGCGLLAIGLFVVALCKAASRELPKASGTGAHTNRDHQIMAPSSEAVAAPDTPVPDAHWPHSGRWS